MSAARVRVYRLRFMLLDRGERAAAETLDAELRAAAEKNGGDEEEDAPMDDSEGAPADGRSALLARGADAAAASAPACWTV